MFGNVAVVGATGAVGQEFVSIIAQRGWRAERFTMLASARSAGKSIQLNGSTLIIAELREDSFRGVDLALFSAGGDISKKFGPIAAQSGAVVVDNSSAFRMTPDVPLVIPEINPDDARLHKGLLANPNCSTIIAAMAVWPLHRTNPVRRMVVSTYQAASGAGHSAMVELEDQTKDILAGRAAAPKVFPHPIAFNLFSHNSAMQENGYNLEEMKMVLETRKIFHAPDIQITATCIRVPVLRAHSESINLTFANPITADEARDLLSRAPGVNVVDDRKHQKFPMPIDASGQDDVLVGRIRQDISQPDGRGLDLFVSGDQLRKGAALNAIQIAELLRVTGDRP